MRVSIQKYFKVIAIVFVLVVIGLSTLLHHTYKEAVTLVKEQFNEQQIMVARQTAIGIEEDLTLIVKELELLSRMTAIRNMDMEEAEKIMTQVFEHVRNINVNDIALIDSKGVCLLPLMASHLRGVDFSYRKYFEKARTLKPSTPAFEFIRFMGVDIGGKGIVIAMPFFIRDEVFGGVILFTIKVDELIN